MENNGFSSQGSLPVNTFECPIDQGRMLPVGFPQLVMNIDIWRSCSLTERFLFAIHPRKTRWAQSVSDRLIWARRRFVWQA